MHVRRLVMPLLFFLYASFGAVFAYAQESPRDGYFGVVSKADKRKPGQHLRLQISGHNAHLLLFQAATAKKPQRFSKTMRLLFLSS